MASSCVPASSFESPWRELTLGDLEGLLRRHRVLGLAEMMNFPGVVSGRAAELAKLALARHVDGHAPGVLGKALNAYAAAGIRSDHEASRSRRAASGCGRGCGCSSARPPPRATCARSLRSRSSTARRGSRSAPTTASRSTSPTTATSTRSCGTRSRSASRPRTRSSWPRSAPAHYHGLDHLGAIAPGYRADVLLLPDLESFVPELVLKAGRPVGEIPRVARARLGKADGPRRPRRAPTTSAIPWRGGRARVIGLVPGADRRPRRSSTSSPSTDGVAVADPARDLAKIAVLERHLGTGRIGLGFVRGFGIQRGAFGATFAHDAHNVVVVGADDRAMARVVGRLRELGGGIVVVEEQGIRAELPLPVAGLLSDRPLAEVLESSRALNAAAVELGVTFPAPFQMLAFLALSVIPSLKITDRGLVDVDRFELVPIAVDDTAAGPEREAALSSGPARAVARR